MPIIVAQCDEPDNLRAQFQRRFVSLFPKGLSSVEQEWFKPGKAKPCSAATFLNAQGILNVIESANPVRVAIAKAKEARNIDVN